MLSLSAEPKTWKGFNKKSYISLSKNIRSEETRLCWKECLQVKGDRALFYIAYYLVLYKTSWEVVECTFYLNMRGYSKETVISLPTAVHFTHNMHLEWFRAQFVGGVVEWGNVWPQLTYLSFFCWLLWVNSAQQRN